MLKSLQVAQHRPRSRRPLDRDQRREGPPKVAYFGATGGGLWKTTDGGENWAPVTDGQIKSASVGAVAVSETQSRHRLHRHGRVVHPRQHHAGRRRLQIDRRRQDVDARRLRRTPTRSRRSASTRRTPNIVFVADLREIRRAERRARRLQEHRRRQDVEAKSSYRDDKTGAVDISIDRTNPNVMYAAMWEAYRKEYQMSSGGPGSGLFKSTDGGETWTEITRNPGLPAGIDREDRRRRVAGADPNRVYALVENENGGLFRSDDAGATWTLVERRAATSASARSTTRTSTADPKNKDLVYVLNTSARSARPTAARR